jgi:hypothetical protein
MRSASFCLTPKVGNDVRARLRGRSGPPLHDGRAAPRGPRGAVHVRRRRAGNRAQDHTQWELAPCTEADLQRQYDLGEEVYGAAVFYKDEICEDYEMPSDQWCSTRCASAQSARSTSP